MQGKITEALQLALSLSSISNSTILIDVLSKMTKAQLLGECHSEIQLLLLERLVQEIVQNDPIEVSRLLVCLHSR